MIFSTYWVCEVITTVGYGDYAGGTTIEYIFTFGIELFGFIIFAVLEISVLGIVSVDNDVQGFISEADFQALNWIALLEKSCGYKEKIPSDIYVHIKDRLETSTRNDYALIKEFDFYDSLSSKM